MEPYNGGSDPFKGGVYSAGHGFFNPYAEPAWKAERRRIKSAANGIGLASVGYVVLSALVAVGLWALAAAATYLTGKPYATDETLNWIINIIVYVTSLAVPFGVYMLCIKIPLKVALPFRKCPADIAFGGIAVGMGVGIAASYATGYLESALELFGIGITMPDVGIPAGIAGKILYVLNMTVIAAFTEEMVFRGVVMQSLRRFGDMFALVTSSLIFGIFHLNLIQMPYAFLLGLCIGYFVLRSGSLWSGVLIHFVNNAVATALTMAEPYMTENAYLILNLAYSLFAVVLGLVALLVLVLRHRDMFRFDKSGCVLSPAKRTRYFLTAPAIIIAFVIAVLLTGEYVYII